MKQFLLLFSAVVFSASCKKEEEPLVPQPPLTISAFSQLAIGNWWAYSAIQVDSMGNYVSQPGNGRDTIRINRDTLIQGETFYIAEGTYRGGLINVREYWRDSANCLINGNGDILFCFGRFNEIIRHDSVAGQYTSDYVVDFNSSYVGTGIGTIPCYVMNVTYNYVLFGQRNWHYKYTAHLGRVKWRIDDPAMPYPIEQRLISYHVQ